MTFTSSSAAILAATLILGIASAESGKNPCHPNRRVESLGVPCEGIYLPPRMCDKCQLSSYDSKGIFDDCTAIYKIAEPACKAELERYSELNQCDTVRKAQLDNFDDPANRKALDYFVYSVCEECCDCIPRGARSDQYDERKTATPQTLTSLVRGNCPAHAHYDICRIWPEIRHITKPGGTLRLGLPKACPLIREWFFSPASKGWFSQDNTNINFKVRRFLRIFNSVARCRRRSTWQRCTDLEVAQNRI